MIFLGVTPPLDPTHLCFSSTTGRQHDVSHSLLLVSGSPSIHPLESAEGIRSWISGRDSSFFQIPFLTALVISACAVA